MRVESGWLMLSKLTPAKLTTNILTVFKHKWWLKGNLKNPSIDRFISIIDYIFVHYSNIKYHNQ